jgi:hypothetical protein
MRAAVRLFLGVLAILSLASSSRGQAQVGDDVDWSAYGHDAAGSRHCPCLRRANRQATLDLGSHSVGQRHQSAYRSR